jgi:hypothetical protein
MRTVIIGVAAALRGEGLEAYVVLLAGRCVVRPGAALLLNYQTMHFALPGRA